MELWKHEGLIFGNWNWFAQDFTLVRHARNSKGSKQRHGFVRSAVSAVNYYHGLLDETAMPANVILIAKKFGMSESAAVNVKIHALSEVLRWYSIPNTECQCHSIRLSNKTYDNHVEINNCCEIGINADSNNWEVLHSESLIQTPNLFEIIQITRRFAVYRSWT